MLLIEQIKKDMERGKYTKTKNINNPRHILMNTFTPIYSSRRQQTEDKPASKDHFLFLYQRLCIQFFSPRKGFGLTYLLIDKKPQNKRHL
jgi:hypothetical protein